jgi:hypothetical protein
VSNDPVIIHAKGLGEDMTLQFVTHSSKGDLKIDLTYKGYHHTLYLTPTGRTLRVAFSRKIT